jgi:polygalacturonase
MNNSENAEKYTGITTDHCTFCSEDVWNGDGWDPDSSKNCTLFASEFFTGDDSVAIKSGKNPEGNIINRSCSHIRVFDCISRFGHGICIGSEMSGGIEDVKIWDCNLENSRQGIEVKGTAKRGGYVKNIQVTDCIMPRVLVHAVGYNDDGISAGEAPIFENFRYDRITLTGQFLEHDHSKIACEVIDIEDLTTKNTQLGMLYLMTLR